MWHRLHWPALYMKKVVLYSCTNRWKWHRSLRVVPSPFPWCTLTLGMALDGFPGVPTWADPFSSNDWPQWEHGLRGLPHSADLTGWPSSRQVAYHAGELPWKMELATMVIAHQQIAGQRHLRCWGPVLIKVSLSLYIHIYVYTLHIHVFWYEKACFDTLSESTRGLCSVFPPI